MNMWIEIYFVDSTENVGAYNYRLDTDFRMIYPQLRRPNGRYSPKFLPDLLHTCEGMRRAAFSIANIDVNDEICFVDIGCTQQQRSIVRSSKSTCHTSIVIDTVKLD